MRPRFRNHVFYRRTFDGVGFWGLTQTCRLEGEGIYSWVERWVPLMDGTRTLDEMTAGLTEDGQANLIALVDVLLEHGFAYDAEADGTHNLSDEEINRFQQSINLIGEYTHSPFARFERFRRSRILVTGEGGERAGLLRFLERLGSNGVTVLDNPRELGSGRLTTAVRSTDAVVYVGNLLDPSVDLLAALCAESGVPFLPGGLTGFGAVVGPFSEPASGGCFACAKQRLLAWGHPLTYPVGGGEEPIPVVWEGLVGTLLGYELFTRLTGMTQPKSRGHLLVITADSLEESLHPVIPYTDCACSQPRQPVPLGQSTAQILEAFRTVADPYTGLFTVIGEGDLPQLPLNQVQVSHPRGLVTAAGLTQEDAAYRAVRNAIIAAGGAGANPPPDHVYSAGATAAEWAVTGFLELIRRRAVAGAAGPFSPLEWSGDACSDCRRHVHALRLRYGLSVRFWVKSFKLGAHVVLISAEDRLLASSAGMTVSAAIHEALIAALGWVQQVAPGEQGARFMELPDLPAHDTRSIAASSPCDQIGWAESLDLIKGCLFSLGQELELHPIGDDLVTVQAGFVVGWVGVRGINLLEPAEPVLPDRTHPVMAGA